MPLGVEVGLGSDYIVLDEDQAAPHGKGHSSPPQFLAHCSGTVAHLHNCCALVYRLDVLPVTQTAVSKHGRKYIMLTPTSGIVSSSATAVLAPVHVSLRECVTCLFLLHS